jgi:predicted NUDIX family phosphoesterase/thymidylate kinase
MDNNIPNEEREKIIAKLQNQANAVLMLKRYPYKKEEGKGSHHKKTSRQIRPVVIEFAGSPKSGKTSCISSLEFFLRRNGFKVEIVQERASVCPVSNKKSPMFNTWTVCSSIVGMLSALEKEETLCDVLILDRGIFDAFCWFDWLTSTKKMEKRQKKAIEDFISVDFIRNRIDIVFVFTATPVKSIEREYANLLTKKAGEIMNTKTLNEYLNSINNTYDTKKQYFHNVIRIDSSDKEQDEVSREVTEKTLDELKSMLMERVGYITPSPSVLEDIANKRFLSVENLVLNDYLGKINFELRDAVEKNSKWVQPVPIAVITNHDHTKILAVKKRDKAISFDSPEKNKILLWVGGHLRTEDSTDSNSKDFMSVCRYTLWREVREELGLSIALDDITPFIIFTPDTPKSKQHMAICFLVEEDEGVKITIDKEELVLNRGKSESGQFLSLQELSQKDGKYFESWSAEVAKHFFKIAIEPSVEQNTLFDMD